MIEQPNVATRAGPALPSGTVAFLFTDIEGSTQRWETHRAEMARAIERHDALIQNAIEAHEGYVFKRMGDAFCVAFRTAPDAIAAACDAQHALTQEDFSTVEDLKVRMAVHVGHVDERGGDYFGPTVNRVARLLGIGHGRQVLVSGAATDLSQGELPSQTALRDLGLHRLKDLAQPEQVYQLIAPDLPQKFPPLRSLDALPNNLPLQLTSFVGREDETAHVQSLVDMHRLTTLVGTGGVGKTRLALHIGADLLDQYEDGVWLVELAPLSDGTLILSELAALFSVESTGQLNLLDAVLASLRTKHALLIVDNCEHLVDPAAEIIEKILRGCPKIRVLATSRESLKITGETVHRVASLDEAAATALFTERANAATDSFELSDGNRATVAKICRRLDGIALAIELAAARVRAMDVEELSARLDERFRLLTGGSRTALPRQQTMRALIDWSYDLLTPAEQTLLRRVAVFAGGWTLDAASAVCSDEKLQAWDVVDQLTSLVDKSLVVTELNESTIGASRLRYRLLESTRQYAAERLEESGERDTRRRLHAEYFAKLSQHAATTWRTTPTKTWLPPLNAEIDNFRSALDWSLAEKRDAEIGGILAGELAVFWRELGMRAEGIRYIDSALAMVDRLSLDTAALLHLARALCDATNWDAMRKYAERAKTCYERLGNALGAMRSQLEHGEALTRLHMTEVAFEELTEALTYFRTAGEQRLANYALASLGRNAGFSGNMELARERTAQVLEAARSQGDERLMSVSLTNLAEQEFALGDTARAIELVSESLERARNNREPTALCFALQNLTAYLLCLGRTDEAYGFAREGLNFAVELRIQNQNLIGVGIQHLAVIASRRGQHERAALLLGSTNGNFDAIFREFTEQREYDAVIKDLREALGEARLSALLQRGAAIPQDQAIADALQI